MKRLRLWLRELSLSQQLMTILFLVISTLTIFIFAFLTPGIQQFSAEEMYRMIHVSHNSFSYYLNQSDEELIADYPRDESGIVHVLYQPDTGEFTLPTEASFVTEPVIREVRTHFEESTPEPQDYYYAGARSNNEGSVLYTVSRLRDGRVLVSLLSGSAETQFRSLLVNNIVNANMLVAIALFIILTVWITSVIVPLNQIRAYINKIKNDEPAVLMINRRDEIGEVADALREMEKELQKQNREKQEMIQNISHDLKTPIATIRSYGESIKDGIYPYGTLEKSIDVIIEHADRLEKKVRSLIALNKMEYLLDDCAEGDTLDMNEVVDKVLLSLKVIRPEIAFERETDRNVLFHGDEDPWRIVVENLVDNALRYADTVIRLELHPGELKVINDGTPIEEDRLAKLFKPYEKGTDGQFGLGLSIVYKIVTTYGYRIEAENLANGVCFRIWKDLDKKEIRAYQREKKKEEREKAKEIRRQEREERKNSRPEA